MARGERNHYHMAFVKLMNTVKPIEFIKKEVKKALLEKKLKRQEKNWMKKRVN